MGLRLLFVWRSARYLTNGHARACASVHVFAFPSGAMFWVTIVRSLLITHHTRSWGGERAVCGESGARKATYGLLGWCAAAGLNVSLWLAAARSDRWGKSSRVFHFFGVNMRFIKQLA